MILFFIIQLRDIIVLANRKSNIHKISYLINAYRVLLTRARQGMVIVIPRGDNEDQTRKHEFFDDTYHYLKGVGCTVL